MYRYLTYSCYNRRCKSRTYRTVLDICRLTVDVAVRSPCLKLGGEAELRLLPDVFQQEQIGSDGSGERTKFLERSPKTLKAAEGQILVQTSSPLHHCSSGPTKSLPPGVLQPENLPTFGAPCQAPQSKPSPIHLLELPTPPLVLGPRQML